MIRPFALFLAVVALTSIAGRDALAAQRPEPAAPRGNWFVAVEPMFVETTPRTGGLVNLRFDDSRTTGLDMHLRGGNGVESEAHAPRVSMGWRWNDASGFSLGAQGRFFDLVNSTAGPARPAPGTTTLPNFATTSETSNLKLYSGDFEAVAGYSRWGFTLEATAGHRAAHFSADGEIEAFGVFTSGNFVELQFSNGSEFRGDGNVIGYTLAYQLERWPVSVFVGRRTATLDGKSDSFGRAVGAVASSPEAPLVGAATVRRNGASATDMIMGETRFGMQADFGSPSARFRSFARLSFERIEWTLDGPPTGGAGFGGTIGNLTTNGFSSAGLGRVNLEGWSLSLGTAF